MDKKKAPIDSQNIKNIGDLITKRSSIDSPASDDIESKVAETFGFAIEIIKENEDTLSNASKVQVDLTSQLVSKLVALRQVDDYDDLDDIREEILKITNRIEKDDSGSDEVKKILVDLGNQVREKSKFTGKEKAISKIKDLSPMKMIKDLAVFKDPSIYNKKTKLGSIGKTIASRFENAEKRENLENIDAEISEEKRSLFGKSDKRKRKEEKDDTPSEVSEYEQPEEKESRSERMIPRRIKKANAVSNVKELKVDKIIVKELSIDERAIAKLIDKIMSKIKSSSGNEPKQQKTETDSDGGVDLPDIDIDIDRRKKTGTGAGKLITGALSGALAGAGRLAKGAVSGAGKLITVAKPIVSTLASSAATGVSKLAANPLARAGAVAYGAANAIDYAAGKVFGMGKNEQGEDAVVDEERDDANWEKMKLSEKIQSGLARGAEYAGSAVGLSNIARSAESDRIQKETEYLKDRPEPANKRVSKDRENNMMRKNMEEMKSHNDPVREAAEKLGIDPSDATGRFENGVLTQITDKSTGEVHKVEVSKEDQKKVQSARNLSDNLQKSFDAAPSGTAVPAPSSYDKLSPDIDRMSKKDSDKPIIVNPPAQRQPEPAQQKETIMVPVKGSVRPSDSSFNRFQDRTAYW